MLIAVISGLSSCMKAGLEELPLYGDSKISSILGEYRYYGPQSWQGQPLVEYVQLTRSAQTINNDANTIAVTFTVPAASGNFTAAERAKVSLNNIALRFTISAAAIIKPMDGAPTLGVPGNWSGGGKKYRVTAADGTYSDWTITVTLNN